MLLITSRETRRWVIPKGGLMKGLAPHAAAAVEAEEEAGVLGAVCPTPIGSYRYRKRRRSGASVWADVDVFPFAVTEELDTWDEQHERERRWFSLAEAAEAVDEEDLQALIRSFGASEFRAAASTSRLMGAVADKTGVNTMFAWIRRRLNRTDFFELFEQQAVILIAGADALARLAQGGIGASRAEHIREIEEREHDGDDITREVLQAVRRSTAHPFDRAAITDLISTMDDAIDAMQQTANAADIYDVTDFEPEMRDMAAIIVDAARLTAEAMPLLRNIGSNGHRLHELTERLVRMEGHADEIHAAGLKRIFKESSAQAPLDFIVRQEMFKRLERVIDRFEDVANEIDGLVIDHA
ncbi:phosphate transport regulator [Novosphingobium malaysiense]|uniref:Phosphate transport regulator n=1 Tax=Novosphingobium malaysiense TaxID=1348853 RepID=A0A0B1ZSZ2_9SPHN|nr:phosphate transport regulator [Novosphingobium malaysiense]